MNIAIIGSGVFGIANAIALSQNKNNKIIIWTESNESLDRINASRDNFEPLGGLKIPDVISFTTSYEEALKDAQIVLLMTAAKFIDSVCKNIKPYIKNNMVFVIGSKGIEQETCRFAHEIFKDNIDTNELGIISGPTFAIDIANLEPSALTCATKSINVYDKVKEAYKGTQIKFRINDDLIGTELCGSIKNVIAIASGMLDGLGYKETTRAFLLTEALNDIKKLIINIGGNEDTVLSYAGIGDLLLTATSVKSRNYSFGILLSQDKNKAKEYLNENTVEGYYSLQSIKSFLDMKGLNMPLLDIINDIVMNDKNPNELIDFIINK